ncbi:MAG: hypothetical protein KDB00_05435 [Planctomycetales bacterium]|nr:hypothetical protein [Planctomycetales bacterium]
MTAFAGIELSGDSNDQTVEISATDWTAKTIVIDGGGGFDSINIQPPSQGGTVPNLSLVDTIFPRNVEKIDLTADDALTVVVDQQAIEAIASTADLELAANLADQIEIVDPTQWRMGTPSNVGNRFLRQVTHLAGASFQIDIPLAWKNVLDRYDVNNDGLTTVLDALVVIYRLASQLDYQLPDPSELDLWPGYYFDTTGDNLATTLDALFVINQLARNQAGQSGEAERTTGFIGDVAAQLASQSSALDFLDGAVDAETSSTRITLAFALDVRTPLWLSVTDDLNSFLTNFIATQRTNEKIRRFASWTISTKANSNHPAQVRSPRILRLALDTRDLETLLDRQDTLSGI